MCKWKLIESEFAGATNFVEDRILQLPFRGLVEDAKDDKRRVLAASAEQTKAIDGDFDSDFMDSDELHYNPEQDLKDEEKYLEEKDDDEGMPGFDDFDPASVIGWVGAVANGPVNFCYSEANKADIARGDGSYMIKICTSKETDYRVKVATDETITLIG